MVRRLLVGMAGKSALKAKGFRVTKAKRKVQRYFGLGRYSAVSRGGTLRRRQARYKNMRQVTEILGGKPRTKRGHKITGISPRGNKALGIASKLEKKSRRRRKVAGGTLVGGSIAYVGGVVTVSVARRKKKVRTAAARRRRKLT